MSAKTFMTEYTLHPSEGPLNLGSLMQHKMSYLLFSCRLESSDKSATNTVTWSKKSKRTATAAYKENTLTAGMVDSAPVNKRWKERKLKRNPSGNWVILIFSGQKPYQNNSNNIAFFFTFFKGYRYNKLSVMTPKTNSHGRPWK